VPAIAEDRDVVGDLEDLVHLVGDVNDGDAFVLERADDAEEVGHLALGNRRGRLIHDDQAGVVGNGFGDLDHLRVGDAQAAHDGVRVDVDLQPLQQRPRVGDHLLLVNQAKAPQRFAPQKNVLGHGHVRLRRQFLVDHGDAHAQRLLGVLDLDLFAQEGDFALFRDVHPDQHLHQGGFAGAVFAHQRMDAAAAHRQLHVAERLHARKRLGNMLHHQHIVFAHALSSCLARGRLSPSRKLRASWKVVDMTIRSTYFM
jgi:hypothetical protein